MNKTIVLLFKLTNRNLSIEGNKINLTTKKGTYEFYNLSPFYVFKHYFI
jgi:hypothetical protein